MSCPSPPISVLRARSCVGHKTIYKLGTGGRKPDAPHPWDELHRLDCSGLVAWCLGYDRYQPHVTFFAERNGGWINTDAIVAAAKRADAPMFELIELPEPGCVVVYGSYKVNGETKIGHTGLITETPPEWDGSPASWALLKMIDCSSGSYRSGRDAIVERPASLFRKRGLFARFTG